MDLQEVLQQSVDGTDAMAADLPCKEVDGFGHFRHEPSREACPVKDWPQVWAVAIVDENSDHYVLHDKYATRQEALSEAQRAAKKLVVDQQARRQLLWKNHGPCVMREDVFDMTDDPYLRLEQRFGFVLFGPLTSSGAALFAVWHGAE